MSKWTEGQRVYVVHIRRYGPSRSGWDTIAKVGRKWATLTLPKGRPERFDIEDGRLDGGGWESPGRVYATEEEYREHQRCAHLWAEFTALVRGLINPPAHMTADDIQKALNTLRKPSAEDQP